jgi:transposase
MSNSKPKDTRPCKVYEFKAYLSNEQKATVNAWLIGLEEVWNAGNKVLDTKRLILSLRHKSEPAETATWKDDTADILSKMRAKKYWPDDSIQQIIPTTYRDGLLDALKKGWKDYYGLRKQGINRGKPKFKSKCKPIKSLLTLNGKTTVKAKPIKPGSPNALVTMPGVGSFKVKAFYKRFPGGLEHGKVQLVKEAHDTFYIQFMARYTPAEVLRNEPRQVGIDPGVKAVVATSDGQIIKPKKFDKKRLKRLQRKWARQQKGSKSRQKTTVKIAKIHAKVKRSRKAYNATLADWLGRFDIAFEGSRLAQMTGRAKPKLREDGKGYERNGAKAKSGLNRALLENGLGQIRTLTKARCKSRNREFIKTADKDVRYSSQRCHCCGERGKRVSQEIFICLNGGCVWHGLKQHADVNAAKNHLKAGFSLSQESYPGATGKVMPLESGATLAGQPGSQSTIATLSEARETTTEATTGKTVQALWSVKDHKQLNQPKAKSHNRLKESRQNEVLAKPPDSHCQLSLWCDAL